MQTFVDDDNNADDIYRHDHYDDDSDEVKCTCIISVVCWSESNGDSDGGIVVNRIF